MEKNTFFDGLSSVAQEVTVSFDSEKNGFYIENAQNEVLFWAFSTLSFHEKSWGLEIHCGENPVQICKIKDAVLVQEIATYRKNNGHLNFYQKLVGLSFKTHLVLTLVIIGFVGLSYLYVIPWLGEKSVVLIPESFDDQLGSAFFEENTFLSTKDEKKSKTLNLFAKELQLKNNKKLRFIVLDSEIQNAFALPDGTIVVYTGILKLMNNPDELVGLLGHEVAHINHRHSMKMLCRNLSGYIFVSTVLGDANGVMAVIGDNVNTLQSLSFSREFERQADTEGLKIVSLNKVNPKGMVRLFEQLQKIDAIKIPKFLSSHPVTSERIQYINDLIKAEKHPVVNHPKLNRLFAELKK